jgi:3-oxoadipate enol-lactonase
VVLLHGLGANSACWQLQIPRLTEAGFRVLAPDMRGFGQSNYPGATSVPLMAADTAGLLASLKVATCLVVGISMGGTVALQLALDHPDLVSRLVLVSTFARLRPDRLSGWLVFGARLLLVSRGGLPSQARAVAQRMFPHAGQELLRQSLYDQVMQADPRAYRDALPALGRFSVRHRLAEIRVPTLIVTGDADTTVSPRNQHELLAIPGSRQVVIPGGGHGLIADHPAEFNEALVGFLK